MRQHGDPERREPEATGSVQELLRAAGFESHLELRDLLLCVPLETADQREEFERWLESDGTKAGLLRRLTNPVWLRKPSDTR